MATNQYNTGGYGYNPLDPRAQFMTNQQQVNATTDPYQNPDTLAAIRASLTEPNRFSGASTPAEVAAAGLRRDDVPNNAFLGSVAGGIPGATGFFGPQDASWLGGAGGPVKSGAITTPVASPTQGMNQTDKYINQGGSWINNPDYDPLAEMRGNPEYIKAYYAGKVAAPGASGPAAPYQAPREDPFAGQNLNDASVQFHLQQYMQQHPDFIPVNTYKGEAPRLPGEINQDTGMRTMEGVSGQNPWITNRGFVQQMPWQNQQQQQYQPQQQQQANPYLQPFQQTGAYQSAMSQNWGGQVQNPYQNQPRQQSMYQQPQQGLLQRFQGQQQQSQPQGNRYGLLSAYGAR